MTGGGLGGPLHLASAERRGCLRVFVDAVDVVGSLSEPMRCHFATGYSRPSVLPMLFRSSANSSYSCLTCRHRRFKSHFTDLLKSPLPGAGRRFRKCGPAGCCPQPVQPALALASREERACWPNPVGATSREGWRRRSPRRGPEQLRRWSA